MTAATSAAGSNNFYRKDAAARSQIALNKNAEAAGEQIGIAQSTTQPPSLWQMSGAAQAQSH